MPKSGQESFQVWLQRFAQSFVDATTWEEFHGIAEVHGVRLEVRANGFVFTDVRSRTHVKASAIHRQLAKTALEARLGTFISAEGIKSQTVAEYQKRPAFWQIDTSRLWEEYQAQRNLRETLREAKYQRLTLAKAQQVSSAKAAARAKRAVIKMTMQGVARRIAYAAVQTELRQTLRAIKRRGREERRALTSETSLTL